MIAKAKELSAGNQQILLAYLHFLHMLELLNLHDPQSNYRNYYYHWVRSAPSSSPKSRSPIWGRAGWGSAHWV